MGYLNNAGLSRFWNGIKSLFVKTINGNGPDSNGNVNVGVTELVSLNVTWSGTNGTFTLPYSYSQIYQKISSGILVAFKINDEVGDIKILYPQSDDSASYYFHSIPDSATNKYYKITIDDGFTSGSVDKISLLMVPSGGSTGQVLTKTASGYAWQSLPIYDGGVH